MSKSYITLLTAIISCSLTTPSLAQISLPKIPHLPHVDLHVPEINIPPIEVPGIPIGHKTNKWEIRHNLEKDGWWVAYGKEIGYTEYYEFSQAISTSITTNNPTPTIAYLEHTIAEGATVLLRNAGREYANKLKKISHHELVHAINDAIQHGRTQTIHIHDLQIQIGIATYNRSETGVPLPNTFQPYIRMRQILANQSTTNYQWVTTLHNPSNIQLHYQIRYGQGPYQPQTLAPNSWRWHAYESPQDPHFTITFDSGPAGDHRPKKYALNTHRLLPGTHPSAEKGEPYHFVEDNTGWNLYTGRPRKIFRFKTGNIEHRGNGQWILQANGQTHTFQEKVRNTTYLEMDCTSRDHNNIRVHDNHIEVLQLSDTQPQKLIWRTYPELQGRW